MVADLPEEDPKSQIKRWKAIKKTLPEAIKKNCENKDQSLQEKTKGQNPSSLGHMIVGKNIDIGKKEKNESDLDAIFLPFLKVE